MRRLAISLFALFAIAGICNAQSVEIIPTPGKVTKIVQTDAGSYVETDKGTFSVNIGSSCQQRVCLTESAIEGLPAQAPKGALPDGFISSVESGDIRKAWYGKPTKRYQHGVLGDAIEGGSLVVETNDAREIELNLPESQVFEDITPRIADLDFDGTNEVVTIRASQTGGAAVVVYGLKDDQLIEIAASAENGQRNRWLNIAGILPNRAAGSSSIFFVRTPHINGRLNQLDIGRSAIRDIDLKQNNFSNHVIGSRELGLSFLDPESPAQLFIPSQDRRTLRQVLNNPFEIQVPGKIYHSVIKLGSNLITATEDGQLLVIFD